jgi:hypothetical protein
MINDKRAWQECWLLMSGYLESHGKTTDRIRTITQYIAFLATGPNPGKESVHPNGLSSLANSGKVRESGRPAAMCTGIGFRMRMSGLCGSGGGPLEVCVSLQ